MREPPPPRPFARTDWLYAGILTLLAALPRLTNLRLAEFKLDEANHYRIAYALTRGAWRWVGSLASVGVPKPPLFVYTLALPLSVTRDPRVAIGFLGFLAALATGGLYLILRRFWGRRAAFAAGLLFAWNPHAILYARKLFTADLLPPLALLFFATGMHFLYAKSAKSVRRALLAVTLSCALLLLTTFSPGLLLPVAAMLLWERRHVLTWRHIVLAALVFALPFIPYLLTVLPRIVPQLKGTPPAGITAPTALPLGGWLWTLLQGTPWPGLTLQPAGLIALLLLGLCATGLLWLIGQARHPETGRYARLTLVWLGLVPLLALITPFEVKEHYLVVLYPVLFVLPAAGVALAVRWRNLTGWIAFCFVVLITLWQGQIWLNIQRDVVRGIVGYGTPLGYWWDAAQTTRALVTEYRASEALLVLPGDQAWDEPAAILEALVGDVPHRVVNGATTAVFPASPAILLLASEGIDTAQSRYAGTEELTVTLPASPFGGTYHYRLWRPTAPTATAYFVAFATAPATRWDSGVQLLGYQLGATPQPGASLPLALLWESTTEPREEDLHWFIHCLDDMENNIGQFDGVGWPATRWQPGDRVIVEYALTIAEDAPPPPYTLRIGQYTYPDLANIPVIDTAGNPSDYAVRIPITETRP